MIEIANTHKSDLIQMINLLATNEDLESLKVITTTIRAETVRKRVEYEKRMAKLSEELKKHLDNDLELHRTNRNVDNISKSLDQVAKALFLHIKSAERSVIELEFKGSTGRAVMIDEMLIRELQDRIKILFEHHENMKRFLFSQTTIAAHGEATYQEHIAEATADVQVAEQREMQLDEAHGRLVVQVPHRTQHPFALPVSSLNTDSPCTPCLLTQLSKLDETVVTLTPQRDNQSKEGTVIEGSKVGGNAAGKKPITMTDSSTETSSTAGASSSSNGGSPLNDDSPPKK